MGATSAGAEAVGAVRAFESFWKRSGATIFWPTMPGADRDLGLLRAVTLLTSPDETGTDAGAGAVEGVNARERTAPTLRVAAGASVLVKGFAVTLKRFPLDAGAEAAGLKFAMATGINLRVHTKIACVSRKATYVPFFRGGCTFLR